MGRMQPDKDRAAETDTKAEPPGGQRGDAAAGELPRAPLDALAPEAGGLGGPRGLGRRPAGARPGAPVAPSASGGGGLAGPRGLARGLEDLAHDEVVRERREAVRL